MRRNIIKLIGSPAAWLHLRGCQAAELFREGKIHEILRRSFYLRKELVVVEMDFESLPRAVTKSVLEDVSIVELNTTDEVAVMHLEPKSRFMKAERSIRRGYRGFAFVRSSQVIGDVWYARVDSGRTSPVHGDVKWLELHPRDGGVYLFDMYIRPEERGLGVAAPVLGSVLRRLRDKGFVKAYGCYFCDNLPALWMHRILKYREVARRKASGVLLWKWSTNTGSRRPDDSLSAKTHPEAADGQSSVKRSNDGVMR